MTTYIYAIGREVGPVKIGISDSPVARLAQIQCGCHFKIEIIHSLPLLERGEAASLERSAHEYFSLQRLSGEWFNISGDQARDFIGPYADILLNEIDWKAAV